MKLFPLQSLKPRHLGRYKIFNPKTSEIPLSQGQKVPDRMMDGERIDLEEVCF